MEKRGSVTQTFGKREVALETAMLCVNRTLHSRKAVDKEALQAYTQLCPLASPLLTAAYSLIKLSKFDLFSVEETSFIAEAYIDANHLCRVVEPVNSINILYERQLDDSTERPLQHETTFIIY